MPTTSQGIYYPDAATNVAPLHTVFSTMASSINSILAGDVQVHRVANTTARNALVSQFPPTAANPLFVWRADAPNGRELEYTKNGSTWQYYSSSEDPTERMVQRGNVQIATGATTGNAIVNFPAAFPGTPIVITSVSASTVWGANQSAQTATSFQANVFRYAGTGAGNVSVNWIAVY